MSLCYIGIGSNLEKPLQQVRDALKELATLPDTQLTATSSLYCSAPIGPQDQDDFINAVAAIETRLSPLELLHVLQTVEQAHERRRERHWGPRTLDLDILLYGNENIATPELCVPHRELPNRAFVILPLLEIDPGLSLPDGTRLSSLVETVAHQHLAKLTHSH